MKKIQIAILLAGLILVVSCKDTLEDNPTPTNSEFGLGLNNTDNLNTVPVTTNFGFGSGNLPSSYDLTSKFPPIGNQEKFGTCVAWATAYNVKTYLNGVSKRLNASQLSSPSNQFSPRDIFTAIPDAKKGQNCSGTDFTDALSLMQSRGVATLATVPYANLSGCSQSNLQQNWTTEANKNKIKYWRRIDATVQSIKENISNNIPVILGAKLGDNFMSWNSDNVLSSNSGFSNVGQHAYHALVISGYDDSKGSRGAFKIVNSWGSNWGSRGYIWVDYNFLVNEFCINSNGVKSVFIAADESGSTNPPDPTPTSSGVDLASWIFSDYSRANTTGVATDRSINFNIYNQGTTAATPSSNWSVYYFYLNAFNANDYGIIFYEKFNTSVANGTFNCPGADNCVFNYTVPAGGNFANAVWGQQNATRSYSMPQISGQYYLVLIADAEDAFVEGDEQNNVFFSTNQPKSFNNGYSQSRPEQSASELFSFKNDLQPTTENLKQNKYNSVVNEQFPNAYTTQEISAFFTKEKKNGNLQKKVAQYINTGKLVKPY